MQRLNEFLQRSMIMICRNNFIFYALLCLIISFNAQATSLDNIYRDIVRSNNSGYLPLFVKNRKQPEITIPDEEIKKILPAPTNLKLISPNQRLKLSSDFDEIDALSKAQHYQWLKTIAAVKSNQVTPLELDEIYNRANSGDAKAIEILAWMYTKGVGVTIDFVEAFNLYKKAALLNVTNAERNAMIVYKAMSENQRQQVKNQN